MAIEVYKRLNYLNEITEKLVELEGSDDALRLTSFYGLTTKEICYKNLVKSFRWDKIKLKRCPKCHAYIDFNLPRSIDRSEKRTNGRQATGSELRASKSNQKTTTGSKSPAIESDPRASKNNEESLKGSEPQVDCNQATRRSESQADKNNNEVTMESESLGDPQGDKNESMKEIDPQADKNNEKSMKESDPRADKNNEKSMKEGDPRTDNESVKKSEQVASSEESKKRIDSSYSSSNGKQANFELGKVHLKVKRKRLLIRCNQCKFTKSFAITSQYKTVYERLYSSYLSGLK